MKARPPRSRVLADFVFLVIASLAALTGLYIITGIALVYALELVLIPIFAIARLPYLFMEYEVGPRTVTTRFRIPRLYEYEDRRLYFGINEVSDKAGIIDNLFGTKELRVGDRVLRYVPKDFGRSVDDYVARFRRTRYFVKVEDYE